MANASSQPSVALAPNRTDPGKDEHLFSSDRKFAMHGEIIVILMICLSLANQSQPH